MARSITLRDFNVNTLCVRHASHAVNNGRMETFAKTLRRLRKDAELTQEQLALACGYQGQSRIANYESTGENARTPSLAEIPVLAKALRVNEAELVAALPPETMQANEVLPAHLGELQTLLSLTARALAATIPDAGRDLVAEIERIAGIPRKGTFAREFLDGVRAEIPVRRAERSRNARESRATSHQ